MGIFVSGINLFKTEDVECIQYWKGTPGYAMIRLKSGVSVEINVEDAEELIEILVAEQHSEDN